jgi:4,5-dihydroxyphthalate decarboxylase
MGRLKVTMGCGRYDRTWALLDGRVMPEGVDLNYIALEPEELFWRMSKYGEFDASEFSLGGYIIMLDRGDHTFVGIPVFPSRYFRHSSVYINVNSGIKRPEDLRGKKTGIPEYTMTASTWIRGVLDHEFGVKVTGVQWFTAGLNEPGRKQRISPKPIPGLSIKHVENETLSVMLDQGEIDALISVREPDCFRNGSKNVARLWPDYWEQEREYHRQTGIFPMMHLIVIRREIYEKNRWLAQSLLKAFIKSKELCRQDMLSQATLRYMLPWMVRELEETMRLMGEDYWPYGLEPNRKALETFLAYSAEQGLTESSLKVEDLFAPETLEVSRI